MFGAVRNMPAKSRYWHYIDRSRNPDGKNWSKKRWQPRDGRLLEHVWEYDGILTDHQAVVLEFGDNGIRQAQDRLGFLFHHGWLNRTSREGKAATRHMVYWLAKRGAEYVARRKKIPFAQFNYRKEPKWQQLEHDVMVNNITISIQEDCRHDPDLLLHEWRSEGALRSEPIEVEYRTTTGKTTTRKVVADSFYGIFRQREGKAPFASRMFLEFDNATHANNRFANEKVLPGIAALRSDFYQTHYRYSVDTGEMIGGRWLVVTISYERLAFLRDKTVSAAGENAELFYFTTYDELIEAQSRLRSEVWLVAGKGDGPVSLFPPM